MYSARHKFRGPLANGSNRGNLLCTGYGTVFIDNSGWTREVYLVQGDIQNQYLYLGKVEYQDTNLNILDEIPILLQSTLLPTTNIYLYYMLRQSKSTALN